MKRILADAELPLTAPEPCPICGAKVLISNVTCWCPDTGEIEQCDYDCETEPDIDSPGWWEWHNGHFAMPYVDWLPWEIEALKWLNKNYRWKDEA